MDQVIVLRNPDDGYAIDYPIELGEVVERQIIKEIHTSIEVEDGEEVRRPLEIMKEIYVARPVILEEHIGRLMSRGYTGYRIANRPDVPIRSEQQAWAASLFNQGESK